jgi:tetratricopeptide (TPR) repeat protein
VIRHCLSLALAGSLALLPIDGAAAATPPPRGATGSLLAAWNDITSFNEDLARIDRARDALEREVARSPSLDAMLLLSWAHLAWGDYRAPSLDARIASYERGRDVARRAIDIAPRSPEAHFWYAANLGRWAVAKGRLQAAFAVSTLRQEIQTVLELDPDNVPGLAVAGSFYLETPSILGGDVALAERYLRKALSLDSHFTRARLELARCLIAQGRYDEARRELVTVIEERRPSYIADWVMRHRPTAERLMAEIRAK